MKKAVRKYMLDLRQAVHVIDMPAESTILSAKLDENGEPCIYALVEVDPPIVRESLLSPPPLDGGIFHRPIYIFKDEQELFAQSLRYFDSLVCNGAAYHLFTW